MKKAFTLIELLVVIAIMAILAAMIIPGVKAASDAKKRARAKGDLKLVESYIDSYKAKRGFYPPSSTYLAAPSTNFGVNPLYYELGGVKLNAGTYTTLDGSAQIAVGDLANSLYVGGFVNSMAGAGSDEGQNAINFFKGLNGNQYREVKVNGVNITVLGTAVDGPSDKMLTGNNGIPINPFQYNSLNPVNNPKSYDLWVDLLIGGKTNRICNWSDKVIVL